MKNEKNYLDFLANFEAFLLVKKLSANLLFSEVCISKYQKNNAAIFSGMLPMSSILFINIC